MAISIHPLSSYSPPLSKYDSGRAMTFELMPSRLLTPTAQLQSAASLTTDIARIISQCQSNVYVLVTQPGVSGSTYTSPENAPELARYMTADPKTSVRSSSSIADIAGTLDTNRWQEILEKECGVTTFHLDTNSMIPNTEQSCIEASSADGRTVRHLPDIKGSRPTLLKVSLPVPHPEQSSRILQDNGE